MKKILSILVAILLALTLKAQQGKEFKYELTLYGGYIVTLVKSKGIGEGSQGVAYISDQNYINNLIFGIIKETITKEKLEMMHARSFITIVIDSKGSIQNCWYSIDKNDIDVLSENDLLNLINNFKKATIDTNVVKIQTGYNFATIGCSLHPEEHQQKK